MIMKLNVMLFGKDIPRKIDRADAQGCLAYTLGVCWTEGFPFLIRTSAHWRQMVSFQIAADVLIQRKQSLKI